MQTGGSVMKNHWVLHNVVSYLVTGREMLGRNYHLQNMTTLDVNDRLKQAAWFLLMGPVILPSDQKDSQILMCHLVAVCHLHHQNQLSMIQFLISNILVENCLVTIMNLSNMKLQKMQKNTVCLTKEVLKIELTS